jgi:hypothetical protein
LRTAPEKTVSKGMYVYEKAEVKQAYQQSPRKREDEARKSEKRKRHGRRQEVMQVGKAV